MVIIKPDEMRNKATKIMNFRAEYLTVSILNYKTYVLMVKIFIGKFSNDLAITFVDLGFQCVKEKDINVLIKYI